MSQRAILNHALDAAIDSALDEDRIVGAVVMVMRGGEMIYRRAAGFADREARTPMREDTIFRLASITKPITSATIMRLVELGVVSLADPVTRWLPEFRPRLPDGTEPEITLEQLLTHKSGLQYRFLKRGGSYDAEGISDGLDQPGLSMAENLARIARAPLAFPPGTRWRYSVGLDVLGAVIAAATGESFPQAVARHVTGPLGMADTAFEVRDRERLATPYVDAEPQPRPMGDNEVLPLLEGAVRFAPARIFDPASFPSGGAGMAGTAPDIMAFLEAIRTGGAPILSRETVAAMMANHAPLDPKTLGPGTGFGYGWSIVLDPDAAEKPHNPGTLAWGGVYGHDWFIDPMAEMTCIALTNTAYEGMQGQFVTDLHKAAYR
ncbi:serine hydrolase domain-containing protein [Amaricoccus macauensis]|uniref:serine hydrolase domain-containing protein n=1 Tax=Amaricoccus macauensis TaxID=57001 RepID=UPI003C7D0E74